MTTYAKKFWEVIGYTYEGEVYCPDCAPEVEEDRGSIFPTDEGYEGWSCVNCDQLIQ